MILATVPAEGAGLGSASDNGIVVKCRGVSRHHARFSHYGDHLSVEDAGSRNGTFVNGLRVERAKLREGDWVQVGPVAFQVEVVESADVEMAINRTAPKGVEIDLAPQQDGTEGWTAPEPGCRPSAMHLLAGVAARLADEPAVTAGSLLGDLALGLEAGSVSLFRVPTEGPAVVLASWGRFDESWSSVDRQAPGSSVWAEFPDNGGGAVRLEARELGVATADAAAVLEVAIHLLRARFVPRTKPSPEQRVEGTLRFPEGYIPGRSPAITRLHDEIQNLLAGDLPVLIVGETGVGKEWVARVLHGSSSRSAGPFVAVNCAAIPAELLEAELFGIEAGVATGVSRRSGRLEQASGGIIFLDEVGDMPLALQAKLLRALQRLEVEPVGGRVTRRVDVRVVAATNSDIEGRVAEGGFRRDLYYRLAGYVLTVPALRARREDIPLLVEHFLTRVCEETGRPVAGVTVAALSVLAAATWPGNVRELEHEVRRLVYRCPVGQAIDSSMISPSVVVCLGPPSSEPEPCDLNLARSAEVLERRLLAVALARAKGNKSKAARLLGLSRPGLTMKMRRLGLGPQQRNE